MLASYLAATLRNLAKHRIHSLISILGLSMGLACCALLAVFVVDELTVAGHHSKGDRVYRLLCRTGMAGSEGSYDTGTDGGIRPAMLDHFPDVENATRLLNWGMWVRHGDKNLTQSLCLADVALFDMFDLSLVHGDPKEALAAPGSMVLTESAAQRYFV